MDRHEQVAEFEKITQSYLHGPVLKCRQNKNMRTQLALFGLLFLVSTSTAQNDFGIGVILGEPSGLSSKIWISRSEAIDAGLAWSFANDTSVQIHADYLRHRVYFFEADEYESRIPVYFGIGGRTVLSDDATLGIRFPIGIGRTFRETPIELFFEFVPILDIIPDSEFALNAAIGARYYPNR